MEEELRALLLADSGVSSHVSDRVNFGTHPQGHPWPAIVLNVISDTEAVHMNGKGPHDGRVQVDCYGMTYGAAALLSHAVLGALNTYRGGGFLFIKHLSTRNTREGGSNEAERPYRAGMDFETVWRVE